MKNWNVLCVYQPGVDVVSELLKNRGIAPEDKAEFLAPAPLAKYIKELSADFRKALVQAKDLILKAIAKDVPIVIHGDYDADGICATAILYQTLTQTLGYTKTMYFLPNRFDQGYGLSKDSVDTIWHTIQKTYGSKSGLIIPGLIITVDCGITAEPEVIHQLKALGRVGLDRSNGWVWCCARPLACFRVTGRAVGEFGWTSHNHRSWTAKGFQSSFSKKGFGNIKHQPAFGH